jgi:glycosyltransferase involved in cell wall biosynthesis
MLSVLMPSWNAEPFLTIAVQGLLDQSFSDWELLIGDDGSTDNTWEIAQSHRDPRVRCYRNPRNQGKVAMTSRLYAMSRGDLVTVHDADDWSFPSRFKRQIELLECEPDVAACGTGWVWIDRSGRQMAVHPPDVDRNAIRRRLLAGAGSLCATLVFRRAVIEQAGGLYRPYFAGHVKAEDADLALRVSEISLFENVPELLYAYRIWQGSQTKRMAGYDQLHGYEFVVELAADRERRGDDAVSRADADWISGFWAGVARDYRRDAALVHRRAASYFLGWHLPRPAVRESLLALSKEPWAALNWKTAAATCIQALSLWRAAVTRRLLKHPVYRRGRAPSEALETRTLSREPCSHPGKYGL